MARQHRHDVAPPVPETPLATPEQPPSPATPTTRLAAPQQRPLLTNVRPPGARPHREEGAEEEALVPQPAVARGSGFASPGVAVALPLGLVAALLVGGSMSTLTAPLIGIAAILLILCVPLVAISREEE